MGQEEPAYVFGTIPGLDRTGAMPKFLLETFSLNLPPRPEFHTAPLNHVFGNFYQTRQGTVVATNANWRTRLACSIQMLGRTEAFAS